MKIEIIADKSGEGYKTANALYEQAFAEIERRDETGQGRALQSAAYRYGIITNDDGEPDGETVIAVGDITCITCDAEKETALKLLFESRPPREG